MKEQKSRYPFSLKALVKFYSRFPIPWWMYLVSVALSLVYAEVMLQAAQYTIRFNKGELYNSVIIGYAAMEVLNSIIIGVRNLFDNYASLKITYRARQVVWEKILRLPIREVDRRKPSALISGVVNDVETASSLMSMLFMAVSSIYAMIRAIMELVRFNARLSSYMLLLIPVAILVFTLTGRLQHKLTRRQYGSLRDMTEFFSEHISAAKHVKSQSMERWEEDAGFQAIEARFRADVYGALVAAVQSTSYSMYMSLDTVITAVFGSDMIRKGQMASTGINDFSTYMSRVQQYLAEVLSEYQTLRGTQGALQYVGEMLEGPEEDLEAGNNLTSSNSDLILEHVTFGYDPAQPVLRDLSLRIPNGKLTAVIGNNGSGKSTLLKLLQGVYTPDEGRILIGETDTASVKPAQLRRQFGCILQNNPLFSGTIRDNITYGVQGAVSDEAVIRAAKLADADSFIRSLPEGYNTDVGEDGKLLSGGQRQRIAIARTLMTNPNYLLMDEAGASLDHESDAAIYRAVRETMQGHTIVVVVHDMHTVMEADYIIVLNQGQAEAAGSHEELLRTSPTYRSYLEKQGYFSPRGEAAR